VRVRLVAVPTIELFRHPRHANREPGNYPFAVRPNDESTNGTTLAVLPLDPEAEIAARNHSLIRLWLRLRLCPQANSGERRQANRDEDDA
jgi:hypothetical protein